MHISEYINRYLFSDWMNNLEPWQVADLKKQFRKAYDKGKHDQTKRAK